MEESVYDSLIVLIEYDGIYGTGIFYQTDVKENTYLITAAHCFYGNELEEKEIDFDKLHLRRQIAGRMEEIQVKILDMKAYMAQDLLLIRLQNITGIKSYPTRNAKMSEEVFVIGFPGILKSKKCNYKRYKLNGYINDFPKADVFQINACSSLDTAGYPAQDVVGGMSGSGVFTQEEKGIILLGIVTDLLSPEGAFNGLLAAGMDCVIEQVGKSSNPSLSLFNDMWVSHCNQYIDDEIVSKIKRVGNRQEELILGHRQCVEFLKQENTSCIQIYGEGGTGKTSYLLKMAAYAAQKGDKAFYIRLSGLNELEDSEKELFLEYQIQTQTGEKNWVDLLKKENIFLLLDGYNEVKSLNRTVLNRQIKKALNNAKVKIVISSRRRVEGITGLFGIISFSMEKLRDKQIESYLLSNNINLEQAKNFWGLLNNPMMLTVYAKTNEEINYNRDSDYFRFYGEIQTKGELISNYVESLIAKQFMLMAGKPEAEHELANLLYVIYFILPYVAYDMEKRREFSIDTDDLYQDIEVMLRWRIEKYEFVGGWFGKRGISDIGGLDNLNEVKVIEYLKDFSTLFCKDTNWRYTHHYFRDQLTAVYYVLECEYGVWKREIPNVICRNMSEEIIEFIGELLGVYKEEYQKKRNDILHSLLDLLRGKASEDSRIALYHILQVWIRLGKNLAGEDFSNLDLKGQILEPYIQSHNGIIKTDFTNAVIYQENLLPIGHEGVVSHICYSPDGMILATASDDGFVCLWDVYTGRLVKKLRMEIHSFVSGLEFSGDGDLIACSCFEYVYVWETENGLRKFCLEGHNGEIIAGLAFHPSGTELASGGHDGNICIWDMKTGKMLFHLEDSKQDDEYYRNAMVLCYSPDGSYLAAGYEDGVVKLWKGLDGSEVYKRQIQSKGIRDIKFSPDGNILATAGSDAIAILSDVSSGRQLVQLKGHQKDIFEINFSPDNKIAATASMDKTIRIWELKTGECLHVLKLHEDSVQRVQFHPYEDYIATAGCDGLVAIWDTDSGRLIRKLRRHNDIVGAISFSPDGQFLATASIDENVCIWSAQSWNALHYFKNNGRRINDLWFVGDEKILTIDYPEQTARKWDLYSRRCIWLKDNVSYLICFHPNGTQYIDCGTTENLQMWDIEKNAVIWQRVFEKGISKFKYTKDGSEIILVLQSGEILILKSETGKTVNYLKEKAKNILLSYDGRYLAGSTMHDIFVWSCQDWSLVASFWKESEGYPNIRFAENSHYLVIDRYGAGLDFINLVKEQNVIVSSEKVGNDKIVQWENNLCSQQSFYLTASPDNEVWTWNYDTGKIKDRIQLPNGKIKVISYHLLCGIAAALYDNGRIIVWNVKNGNVLSDISVLDEGSWKLRFNENGDRLIFVSGPIVYSLDWRVNKKEILLDQRYEEHLIGCRLKNALFDSDMRLEDIMLLKSY